MIPHWIITERYNVLTNSLEKKARIHKAFNWDTVHQQTIICWSGYSVSMAWAEEDDLSPWDRNSLALSPSKGRPWVLCTCSGSQLFEWGRTTSFHPDPTIYLSPELRTLPHWMHRYSSSEVFTVISDNHMCQLGGLSILKMVLWKP